MLQILPAEPSSSLEFSRVLRLVKLKKIHIKKPKYEFNNNNIAIQLSLKIKIKPDKSWQDIYFEKTVIFEL